MGYRTGLVILASAHPKPGHPAAPHPWWTTWTPAVVGAFGLIGLWILVWGIRRRRAGQQAGHPRRDLLGWALILAFCVGLSLLTEHVEVSSGLSLVVNSLSCIVPPAFALWLAQKSPDGTARQESSAHQDFLQDFSALIRALTPGQANGRSAPAAQDVSQSDPADNVAVLKLASQGEGAEAGPATLADARQTVQVLRAQVAGLRSRVLSAVIAYGPGEDWRLLLARPRYQLDSCTALLDQLGRARNRWADFGATSAAFTDTLAKARRAAASLGEAIEERTDGRPARTDLAEAAGRLDHVVGQLAGLLDSAAPGP
jgi:hypothetical protein